MWCLAILVLTENVSNEQQFHENLQRLNYEVFTSAQVLQQWRKTQKLEGWSELFSLLVISETISTEEADDIVRSISHDQMDFLRKVDTTPSEGSEQKLLEKGYGGWLMGTASLNQLRETLFAYRKKRWQSGTKNSTRPSFTSQMAVWDILKLNLSPVEEKMLRILMQHSTMTISRKDIIQEIWEDEPNNSNLSQLSYRIGSIKRKITHVFGLKEPIITDWRKGYRLSQEFCELFLDQN